MQVQAKLSGARLSAQKARLVADQVRGRQVEDALNLLTYSSKKGADVIIGGSPAGVQSGLMATVQRSIDPTKRSLLPEEGRVADGIISPIFAAWQDSVAQYTSRNPFFNNERKIPILDPLTGEEVTIGDNWGAGFNPYRTRFADVRPEYEALLKNGVPIYNPPRSLEGYDLSDVQYQEWIKLATIDYEVGDRVIDMAADMESEEDLGLVQRSIRREMTGAYTEALKELIENYPDLEDYLENKDLESIVEGLYSYY